MKKKYKTAFPANEKNAETTFLYSHDEQQAFGSKKSSLLDVVFENKYRAGLKMQFII